MFRIVNLFVSLVILLHGFLLPAIVQAQAADLADQKLEVADAPVLIKEPVPVYRMELGSEALALWRQYAPLRPTLLLLSNDPMLARVPAQVEAEVSKLAASASHEQLLRMSDYGRSSPLFLTKMTLDVALRQGWFQQLVWAFPSQDANQPINLEAVSGQFRDTGYADERELGSFAIKDQAVHGTLRGVPMTMAPLAGLDGLTGPVLVHIDQSYFKGMYKNEVATPLLEVVTETLRTLREKNIQALAVTFANGNLDRTVSLNVRFLQEVVPALIENPDMLEATLPTNWQRQKQILYLANFFRTDEIRELALAMHAESPDSAWVKFALYLSSAEQKRATEALNFLAEAVALDKIYALEYLSLSDMAYEKGYPDEAMRMFSLAAQAFPDNVQIKLNMARLASDMGDNETARHLVEQLQKNEWSPLYYADMPRYLEDFKAFLQEAKALAPQPEAKNPEADPKRQRILK